MLMENGVEKTHAILTVSALIPTEVVYQGERSTWSRGDLGCSLEVTPGVGLTLRIERPETVYTELVEQYLRLSGEMRNFRDWLRFRESRPGLDFAEQPEFRYVWEGRPYSFWSEAELDGVIKRIEDPHSLSGTMSSNSSMQGTLTLHAALPKQVPELSAVAKPLLVEYFHVLGLSQEPGTLDVAYRAACLLMERIGKNKFSTKDYWLLRNFVSHAECNRNPVLNFVRLELPSAIQRRNGGAIAEFDRTNIDHMNLVGRFFSQLMHELRHLVESRAFL